MKVRPWHVVIQDVAVLVLAAGSAFWLPDSVTGLHLARSLFGATAVLVVLRLGIDAAQFWTKKDEERKAGKP